MPLTWREEAADIRQCLRSLRSVTLNVVQSKRLRASRLSQVTLYCARATFCSESCCYHVRCE